MGRVRRQNIAPCESNILFSWADFSALPTLKICVQKGACALQTSPYASKRLWSAPALLTCLATLCILQLIEIFSKDIAYVIPNAN